MHVYTYVSIERCMYVRIYDGFKYVCNCVYMYLFMYICIFVCMYVCTYLSMNRCFYIFTTHLVLL